MGKNSLKRLKEASIEELQAEIEARKTSKESSDRMFMGIIDQSGVESFVEIKDFEHFDSLYSSMSLRARFNTHRDPIIYSVKLPLEVAKNVRQVMKDSKFQEAGEIIMDFSNFQKLPW